MRLDNVQQGESRGAACVDAFTVQTEADTMIAERSKDFEQVPDALARQIVRRGRDHLIDRIQIGQECLPTGIASANGRALIVDVGSNYDDATVLDCLPEVPTEVHLGVRTKVRIPTKPPGYTERIPRTVPI
jgi:hypothetical protein